MIITMKAGASREQIDQVIHLIEESGYQAHPIFGSNLTVLAAVGDERGKSGVFERLNSQPGVAKVEYILPPYKLVCREVSPGLEREKTVVRVEVAHKDGVSTPAIGDGRLTVIAGPCSVESLEQVMTCAAVAKKYGATFLRGGAFKPRTSPYSFQGLAEEGLKILAEARHEFGLGVVTELMDAHNLDLVQEYADIIQIGARNMQNFMLLKSLGETTKPILLKRGMSSSIDELLMSAEYVVSCGNPNVILCERGIRTFETAYRNTLDLNAVPTLRESTHLPVVVDPSHGTGRWKLVKPMSLAAVAAGADGLIIEIHPEPAKAFSDGQQSLKPEKFAELMSAVARVAHSVDRLPCWED
ncbi:MAG: 3-deoxy-7-phosphoheptulonate synthase [bacterium]